MSIERISNIAGSVFTGMVIVGIVILVATQAVTPDLMAMARARVAYWLTLWPVMLMWINRLALAVAGVIAIYMLYAPVKQATGIGQVHVKLID